MNLEEYMKKNKSNEEQIASLQQEYMVAEGIIENLQEELNQLKESINKIGYSVKQLDDRTFELAKTDEVAGIGEYTNPIPYVDGMEVVAGSWYSLTDGNIWECIKSDATSHMTSEWFDIIS